jgi:hypothetical protein
MGYAPRWSEFLSRGKAVADARRAELRASIAAAALPSLPAASWDPEQVAQHAVAIADAVIRELERPPTSEP